MHPVGTAIQTAHIMTQYQCKSPTGPRDIIHKDTVYMHADIRETNNTS